MLLHLTNVKFYRECNRQCIQINTEAARNTQTLGGKPINSSEILFEKKKKIIINSNIFFSEAVWGMKLKFSIHAYDISLYKVCVFLLSLSNYFGCYGNLKFPLTYEAKSGNLQFLPFH